MKKNTALLFPLILTTSLLVGCGGSDGDSTETTDTDTTTGTTTSTATLVINEIVADAEDDGNDWIELYALDGSVDLSNYTIVDDSSDHTPQALPSVTLSEGEFIVIQAIDEDDTPPESGYYVTFKLGSDDAVTLYKDGVENSQLDWAEGEVEQGYSYGLFADGSGSAQTLSPTPGAMNEQATDDSSDDSSDETTDESDTVVSEDAPLRINEVVTKALDDGLDWIELYVSGESDINLSDYTLTDEDGVLSSLPNVTLAPGDFYRIYASKDTVDNTTTVAFSLGANDEVRLFLGDDLIDQLSWNKGQALIGYSFGRFPDGSDATQTLTPSALTTNITTTHGPLVINEVVANDANEGADWFELFNNSEENIALADYQVIDESDDIDPVSLPDITLAPGEYVVIYAVDEEADTEGTNDYYVPFKLGNSDELSLILNDETVDYLDWDDSDVISGYSFGLTNNINANNNYTDSSSESDGWDKDTLTPTPASINVKASAFDAEIVNDLYINITTTNWQDILDNPLDEEYHETSITFNGITLDSVAIRTKGGSSLSSVAQSTSDRYSFKIDINEYVDGQKFLGLKKFTLQNSFNDPSYMREVIAYDLLEEMGIATPKHSYVNFYVNGELFGLYLMVEAVDGEFIEDNFSNTNGDLYKPDGVGSDLVWIDDDISSYSDINLKSNEETTDQGAFINFVSQMDEGSTAVIDIDGLLRYMSVSVALSNLDSYHGSLAHNYYLYEQDGIFSLLPWDFNEAFGSFSMNCDGTDVRELYIDEPTSGALSGKPMIANVFADNDNLDTYHDYLWQLIDGSLSTDIFSTRINEIADLIRTHVNNDPSGFYTAEEFEQNLTSTVDRFYGLTEFMTYRVANMKQQLQGDIDSEGDGSGFCGDTGSGGGPGGGPPGG